MRSIVIVNSEGLDLQCWYRAPHWHSRTGTSLNSPRTGSVRVTQESDTSQKRTITNFRSAVGWDFRETSMRSRQLVLIEMSMTWVCRTEASTGCLNLVPIRGFVDVCLWNRTFNRMSDQVSALSKIPLTWGSRIESATGCESSSNEKLRIPSSLHDHD